MILILRSGILTLPAMLIFFSCTCRLSVDEGGLTALVRLSNGDMRKALNILQVCVCVWIKKRHENIVFLDLHVCISLMPYCHSFSVSFTNSSISIVLFFHDIHLLLYKLVCQWLTFFLYTVNAHGIPTNHRRSCLSLHRKSHAKRYWADSILATKWTIFNQL